MRDRKTPVFGHLAVGYLESVSASMLSPWRPFLHFHAFISSEIILEAYAADVQTQDNNGNSSIPEFSQWSGIMCLLGKENTTTLSTMW